MLRASGYMTWAFGLKSIQGMMKFAVNQRPGGPDEEVRARGRSWIWGEIRNQAGDVKVSRLVTPEGYSLTVETALKIVDRVMRGQWASGFQTPAGHYGSDLVLEVEGVVRTDD